MLALGLATLAMSAAVTWLITPAVIRVAHRLGAVDLPGARKMHDIPMPRIGGVAVFVGFVTGLVFAALCTGNLLVAPKAGIYWRGLGIAATAIFVLGLIDDLWDISFLWKLAGQIVAAAYMWNCGFRIEVLSHPFAAGGIQLGEMALPITILWIVAITNAVNLIDGLDGLAAGTALIMTTTLAVLALFRGQLGVATASVALAGSLVGFLRFNFNPARIFLGDSGSMFLGFVLAVTSVRGSQKGPTAVAVLVPVLVLGLPLLDTGLAIARRFYRLGNEGFKAGHGVSYVVRNTRRVFMPDREHIHHKLIAIGLSHRGAVLTLYGVAGVLAAGAMSIVLLNSVYIAVLLLSVLTVLIVAFLVVVRLRNRDRQVAASPEAQQRPLASDTVTSVR